MVSVVAHPGGFCSATHSRPATAPEPAAVDGHTQETTRVHPDRGPRRRTWKDPPVTHATVSPHGIFEWPAGVAVWAGLGRGVPQYSTGQSTGVLSMLVPFHSQAIWLNSSGLWVGHLPS